MKTNIGQVSIRHVFTVSALSLLAACVSEPTIDTSPEAEATFDGLYPVKGGSADQAWARPGIDLSGYSKIRLQGAGVEYRPGGESGRMAARRSTGGPFEVTEAQKAGFRAVMAEAFLDELEKSEQFTLVQDSGPDVLLIRGALLDVVSYVPPEPTGPRDSIYLSRVGEATLVLEIRDSVTETVLVRVADRRAAESMGYMQESNRITNTAEVKRLARGWARLLRERLDEYAAKSQ